MSAVATAIVGGAVVGAYATSSAADKAAKAQQNASRDANATQLYMHNQTRDDQTPWRDSGNTALSQMMTQMGYLPAGYASSKDQIKERLLVGGNYVDGSPELGAKIQSEWDREQSEIAAIRANPEFGTLSKNFSMADFQADPGYQFRMSEGQKAIERSAAARGGVMSGRTLKDITRFGQDTASAEYQNAYNRFNNDRTTRFNRLASVAGVGQTANNVMADVGQNTANAISQNELAAGNARSSAYIAQGNAANQAIGGAVNGFTNYTMLNRMLNRMFPTSTSTSGTTSAPAMQVDTAYSTPPVA